MQTFTLENVGGRRRAMVTEGGSLVCHCRYLGPESAAVDLVMPDGAVHSTLRGGRMPVPDFHLDVAGERLRVWGATPRFTAARDGGAERPVTVEDTPDGWRSWDYREVSGSTATLQVRLNDVEEPWRLEVASHEDPLRMLAVLHAAERLTREAELRAAQRPR